MSSSEGAGSVEQTVTGTLRDARVWKARAAVVVVLPTPPLPTVNDSGAETAGHLVFVNFNFAAMAGGFCSTFARLRAKTTSPKFLSGGMPRMGFPGSVSGNNGT